MPTGEVVQVKFGGTTDELNTAIENTKNKLAEVHEPVDVLSEKLSSLGRTFIEAFTLDKIGEFISSTAEAAKEVTRLETISGLSASTIQTLQFAMEVTGGNAETAGMMMTRFERSIYEAAAGSGPAYQAFEKLGVSLNDLRHDSQEEIFKKAIDGFHNIKDTAERAQIGILLMSRGFLNVSAAFAEGTQGLQRLGDELTETSAKMNSARLEAFDKLFEDLVLMKDAFKGLGETILSSFIQSLTKIVEWVTKITEFFTALIQKMEVTKELFLGFSGLESKEDMVKNIALIGNAQDQEQPGAKVENRNAEAQAEEARLIQQQLLEDKMRLYQEDYQNFVAKEALKVAEGKETKAQELQAAIHAAESERDLQMTTLDEELALHAKDKAAYQKLQDEKLMLAEKFETEIIQLQARLVTEQNAEAEKAAAVWKSVFNEIGADYDRLVSGFFTRTQTMGQAFQKFAQEMVIQFTEAITKMMARWAGMQIFQAAGWTKMATALGGASGGAQSQENGIMQRLVMELGVMVGITTEQTAAITLGTAALAANMAAVTANTVALEMHALNPIGTPGLIPGLAVGTPYVPNDMVAKIHKGEMIIPAGPAEAIRQGSISTLNGGDAGHVHFHISAMDSAGVKKTLMRNSAAIAAAVTQAARGGNSTLRTAFAKM